jgi:hypothetical protein
VSEGVGASTVSGFSGDKIVLALDGAGAVTLNGSYRNVDARLGGVGSLNIDAAKAERMDLACAAPASSPSPARPVRCARPSPASATSTRKSCAPKPSTST